MVKHDKTAKNQMKTLDTEQSSNEWIPDRNEKKTVELKWQQSASLHK